MIGKLNDGFGNNGWSEGYGYADLESDENEIVSQLYEKIPRDDLIEYVDEYLQGYELGQFMSEEIEEIYDEDGFLKENEYNLGTISHYKEAKEVVLKKEKIN